VIDIPVRALGRRAEEVEDLGFDRFWLPDERLTRNVYTGLTVSALHTETLRLGVAVTNPYSRNVALTAAAAATIDELSGGRFSLGFGAGGATTALSAPAPPSRCAKRWRSFDSCWPASPSPSTGAMSA